MLLCFGADDKVVLASTGREAYDIPAVLMNRSVRVGSLPAQCAESSTALLAGVLPPCPEVEPCEADKHAWQTVNRLLSRVHHCECRQHLSMDDDGAPLFTSTDVAHPTPNFNSAPISLLQTTRRRWSMPHRLTARVTLRTWQSLRLNRYRLVWFLRMNHHARDPQAALSGRDRGNSPSVPCIAGSRTPTATPCRTPSRDILQSSLFDWRRCSKPPVRWPHEYHPAVWRHRFSPRRARAPLYRVERWQSRWRRWEFRQQRVWFQLKCVFSSAGEAASVRYCFRCCGAPGASTASVYARALVGASSRVLWAAEAGVTGGGWAGRRGGRRWRRRPLRPPLPNRCTALLAEVHSERGRRQQ